MLQSNTANTEKAVLSIGEHPLPNGVHDLQIPDEPHPSYGQPYEQYSIYAQTWFLITNNREYERYLHFGNVSAGCVTVSAEKNGGTAWNELYKLLITARKGDSLSVGTLQITD
jgi:hypothetical protein